MTTKNKILLLTGILFVIAIALFETKTVCAEKSTPKAADGMKLKKVLAQDPKSIILYGFDEKEHKITDKKDIKIIIDTLKNASYKKLKPKDYYVGFYMVDLKYDNETIPLGVGSDCLAYDNAQYAIKKGTLDKAVNVFNEYLK